MISIVIPTITGREHWLALTIHAYKETLGGTDHEMIVMKDTGSCGIGWNRGRKLANGDYVHLTCDDNEPQPGWHQAATAAADRGDLPAPRILNTDLSLQSCGTDDQEHDDGEEATVSRLPFATREQFAQIGPLMDEQYMSDHWFSHRGRELGYPTVVVRDYCFVHHLAQEGRMDTLSSDIESYFARGGTEG